MHFNARSLNANFEQIKDFLQTLDITFDVVAISETWVEVGNATDYDLLNYHAFHTERCHKKGGGVAIYVKVECPTVWSTQRQIRPFLHMY